MRDSHEARAQNPAEPKVGIFWWFRDHLLTSGIPARQAVAYGEHAIYERGHAEQWQEWQQRGVVPGDTEYDEFPRGRISFHRNQGMFRLLSDRCILARSRILGRLIREMHLPKQITVIAPDLHYRCAHCMRHGSVLGRGS